MKYLAIFAVIMGCLAGAGGVDAFSERLSANEAYQAQKASCQFGQTALVGAGWATCEQYIHEWVGLSGAAEQNQTVRLLQTKILELVQQISQLQASLATLD